MNRKNMIILGSHDHEEVFMDGVKLNGHRETSDPNSYKSLCENSIEICELCDKVSKNRYTNIIHTAKHIIIPLLNQKVYQCVECLHHFTSINSLNRHISIKHGDITKPEQILVNDNIIDVDNYVPIKKKKTKIKNRLLFEEDVTETDVILTDLTTECKVNLETFPAPLFGNEQNDKTVSYAELIRPGVYKCKCREMFPNRYLLITHQTRHLSLSRCQVQLCRICNTYVTGDARDLSRHIAQKHEPKPQKKCYKCGKMYDDVQKHKIYCPMNSFDYYENKMVYKKNSKIINLCDMCFKFCKTSPMKQYTCVGVASEMGKRFTCERCGSQFFEVKRVERMIWHRGKEKDERKRKTLSNEDRLKNIQQRIKMLK